MIVETEAGRYGFVVDEVLGDCQTVIKNLGRFYRHVQVVSGATILGNGTVALILDPERLAQDAVRAIAHGRARASRAGGDCGGRQAEPARRECGAATSYVDHRRCWSERQRPSNQRFNLLSLALPSLLLRGRTMEETRFKRKGGADFMPTALVSEGRKLHGAVSGNGGNGHGAP